MKIALIAAPYVAVPPSKYGGTERIIYYLIKGLKEAGHEPILVGPGDSDVDCEVVPTVPHAIGLPKTKKELKEFRKIEKKAFDATYAAIAETAKRVDVLHSNGIDHKNYEPLRPKVKGKMTKSNTVDFNGVDLLKFAKYPNVTTMHNRILLEHIPYLLRRKRLNFVCISNNQKAALDSMNTLGVAYNGLDPDEFPIRKRAQNYVCFVGRFDRDKSPHLAIELALSLGIKIKLAGKIDVDSDGYFDELIKPHLDNPLVEYLGELGFEEKVKVMSNAKCNLHPTNFREPFGLTVLEAAYCGTPSLAISRGSMPELIEDGKTGMLVEDFIEGYEALEKCFKLDREYIAKRSREQFNYNRMASDYLKLYELAIKKAKPPRRFFGLGSVGQKLKAAIAK